MCEVTKVAKAFGLVTATLMSLYNYMTISLYNTGKLPVYTCVIFSMPRSQ